MNGWKSPMIVALVLVMLVMLPGCATSTKNKVALEKVVEERVLEEKTFATGETKRVATFAGPYTRDQIQEFFVEWKKEHPDYEIIGDPQIIKKRFGIFSVPYLEVVFQKRQQPLVTNNSLQQK
jgi:hypothetical protein